MWGCGVRETKHKDGEDKEPLVSGRGEYFMVEKGAKGG